MTHTLLVDFYDHEIVSLANKFYEIITLFTVVYIAVL